MLPVAIVLLILIVAFIVGAIASNTEPTTLNIFIAEIPATTGGLFITGLVTALVLAGSLLLLWFGIRHQRRKSADLRALKKSSPGALSSTKDSGKAGFGRSRRKDKNNDGTGNSDNGPTDPPPPPRRNKTLLDL